MISSIRGKLIESGLLSAVIEVCGLGYEVHIPITSSEKLPNIGSEVFLYTYSVYREDSQSLYGFVSKFDRDFFKLLIEKVTGIGPKTGIAIFSKMSVEVLVNAIDSGDCKLLAKCPGIGPKTAERIILELKGKTSFTQNQSIKSLKNENILAVSKDSNIQDSISALIQLGYKAQDADKAVKKALAKVGQSASTEEIIKACFS